MEVCLTQNSKKITMKKLPFLLIILISPILFAQIGQKNFIDQPYIEVTGKFEKEILPNEIYVTIILNENDKKGKNDVEKQEQELIQALQSLGINVDKQLTIQDFDGSYQKYFLHANTVNKIKKYQLLIESGKKLGEVYQVLSKLDISTIKIDKISHSDIEKYQRETKLNALQAAKEKAQEYARAIDQEIGKAIFIQEYPSTDYSNLLEGVANGIQVRGYDSEQSHKIYDLQFQPIKLTATIQTKFILN